MAFATRFNLAQGSHFAKKLCKSPKSQVSTAMEKFYKRISNYNKTGSTTANTSKFARVKGWAKKHRCLAQSFTVASLPVFGSVLQVLM